MEYLNSSAIGAWPFYLFIVLLGLSLGSFLNSWLWRTLENMKISGERSICPFCSRQLSWYENIPVLSFLWLRGRCRSCLKFIPWHYLAVEIITPLLLVFIAWYRLENNPGDYRFFARDIFFLTVLITVFMFDFLRQTVYLSLVWFAAIFAFAVNYFILGYSLTDLLLAALTAGGFFLFQYIISRGRWIGGGDIHIGIMMGFFLGWAEVLVALFLSYIIGSIVGLSLFLFRRKGWKSEIPFGTFLAIGTFVAIYWGNNIIGWYLGMIR